jgi:DNA-binding MarR family transcriptional regulator
VADPDSPWSDDVAFPALLRGARAVYGAAIRAALAEAGFGDGPKNGAFVLGGMARTGVPLARIVADLGISKQAAGQLVDTLVARGYLDRAVDPTDRRRLTITLTARGRAAASTVRAAVGETDAAVVARLGPDAVGRARAALVAIIEVGEER